MRVIKKETEKKKIQVLLWLLLLILPFVIATSSYAISDDQAIQILIKNKSLFKNNDVAGSVFRYLGWGITHGLAALGNAVTKLYDICFGFVDFTKYGPVNTFISQWKNVFVALVCLSLLFIGILLCIGWEKKPQIAINLLIVVTVVSASTYIFNQLNSLISKEVRNEIIGQTNLSDTVYTTIGQNIHDLVWLDKTVGLENLNAKDNAKKVYSSFNKEQFQMIDINETVDPDNVSEDAESIIKNGVIMEYTDGNKISYKLDKLYDGVAWTDLFNKYYYRYTVDWGTMYLELLSLIIIFLFMSYKVIKILYEIVVHRLLVYLYAANLNNNQKVLKILDSLKDSYILLILTTVLIKFYLLASKYISAWDISGLTKGLILIFLSFAVIDGPNLIQRLTGTDIGASDSAGKMMSLMYGSRMVVGAAGAVTRTAGSVVKGGAGAFRSGVSGMFSRDRSSFSSNKEENESELFADSQDQTSNSNLNQQNQDNYNRQGDKPQQIHNNTNQKQETDSGIKGGADLKIPGADTKAENPLKHSGEELSSTMPEGKNDEKQTGGASKQSPISAESGKKQGGYRMNDIGKISSQKDVLNGSDANRTRGYNRLDQTMRKMDQDISGASADKKEIGSTSMGMFTSPSLEENSRIFSAQSKNTDADDKKENRMPGGML